MSGRMGDLPGHSRPLLLFGPFLPKFAGMGLHSSVFQPLRLPGFPCPDRLFPYSHLPDLGCPVKVLFWPPRVDNPLKNYLDKRGSVPTFARYLLITNRTAKSVQRLKSGNYEERSSPKKLPPRGV